MLALDPVEAEAPDELDPDAPLDDVALASPLADVAPLAPLAPLDELEADSPPAPPPFEDPPQPSASPTVLPLTT